MYKDGTTVTVVGLCHQCYEYFRMYQTNNSGEKIIHSGINKAKSEH